jgi:hypothetical protein
MSMHLKYWMILSLGFAPLLSQEAAPQPAPNPEMKPPETTAPAPAPSPTTPAPEVKPVNFKVLDNGLLQEAWFCTEVAFQKGKDIDFLWVKPGFKLAGHQLRLKAWEAPTLLIKDRDAKDRQKATELTYVFPIVLRNGLSKALVDKVKFSSSEGDYTLSGRFVDVNAGSEGAKFIIGFGAGSASATWDLKIVDTKTNELQLAVHHRCISGSAFSGIQDKLEKWSRAFGQYLSEKALQ